eukprot:gb/GECG01004371.1/.p1 GENE.gb/GECG01004371.1/~~gb/GECG01004371.1/.p1  ORF type:complete len:266 (+),score=24.61 gb/GECG01004371.1/:1-798(+)
MEEKEESQTDEARDVERASSTATQLSGYRTSGPWVQAQHSSVTGNSKKKKYQNKKERASDTSISDIFADAIEPLPNRTTTYGYQNPMRQVGAEVPNAESLETQQQEYNKGKHTEWITSDNEVANAEIRLSKLKWLVFLIPAFALVSGVVESSTQETGMGAGMIILAVITCSTGIFAVFYRMKTMFIIHCCSDVLVCSLAFAMVFYFVVLFSEVASGAQITPGEFVTQLILLASIIGNSMSGAYNSYPIWTSELPLHKLRLSRPED